MKTKLKRKQGQAMVEYIIIVAVVAVAALVVFGLFGDTIRTKMSGAINTLDSGENADLAVEDVQDNKSGDFLKDLDEEGNN
ncbi:hypothetical protein P4B35_20685 [Pontiellaceae bacterium B12227]|nr:hypothetical protein [Pontiellaceae bacterium B12227]